MDGQNENLNSVRPKQEICTMRIAFPVTSDEKAIEYKKKISDILADVPEARIEFSIMSIPIGASDARPVL